MAKDFGVQKKLARTQHYQETEAESNNTLEDHGTGIDDDTIE
jgi:hypothetical protein